MEGQLDVTGWGKAHGTQRHLHPSSSQVLSHPYLPSALPDPDRVGCTSTSLKGHEGGQAPVVTQAPLTTLQSPPGQLAASHVASKQP